MNGIKTNVYFGSNVCVRTNVCRFVFRRIRQSIVSGKALAAGSLRHLQADSALPLTLKIHIALVAILMFLSLIHI